MWTSFKRRKKWENKKKGENSSPEENGQIIWWNDWSRFFSFLLFFAVMECMVIPQKKVRQVKELKKKGKNEKKNFSSRSYHHSIQYIFSNLKIVCIHHPIHIIILILFYTLHFFPSIFFRLDFSFFPYVLLVELCVCVWVNLEESK